MDQEQCSSGSGPPSFCAQWKGDQANLELEGLLHEMKRRLASPDVELSAEKAWEQYRDEECGSRARAVRGVGGWEVYGECNASLTELRVGELRTYHFCDLPGCPGKKP
jgi:uncharacterized protein YecT (DUF1311 family)